MSYTGSLIQLSRYNDDLGAHKFRGALSCRRCRGAARPPRKEELAQRVGSQHKNMFGKTRSGAILDLDYADNRQRLVGSSGLST
jgi:hypothetical protein